MDELNVKSFWSKREGKVGAAVLILLVVFLGFGALQSIAAILALVATIMSSLFYMVLAGTNQLPKRWPKTQPFMQPCKRLSPVSLCRTPTTISSSEEQSTFCSSALEPARLRLISPL